jgi:hypothetical protein
MVTKLTLKLKKKVIEQAKQYASDHDTSLSRLIENYLSAITTETNSENDISTLVKSLSGIIELPVDADHKGEYNHHLIEKYL